MRRAPLVAAWAVTLAALAATVAWIEMGESPDPADAPVLTLVIPDRPAAPAAGTGPEAAAPAAATGPETPKPADTTADKPPPAPEAAAPVTQENAPAPVMPTEETAPVHGGASPPPAPRTTPAASEPPPNAPETTQATVPEAAPEPAPAPQAPEVPTPVPAQPEAAPPAATPPTTTAEAPNGFHGVDPRLVEDSPNGPLPIVGPLGRKPWQVYARPFEPGAGRPRIAVVLTDLGLGATASRKAVDTLPPAVSLSFLSYADDVAVWLQRARADGHEVLIDVPMEPAAKTDDPGPRALTTSAAPDATIDDLEWHLSRGSAYIGIATFMGGGFLATESAVRTIMAPLRDRGLMMLDASGNASSTAARVAREMGVPFAAVDTILDQVPSRAAIDRRLAEIEEIARTRGSAVAVGRPYPVTIDAVAAWTATLAERGFDLAPVSAVAGAAAPPAQAGGAATAGKPRP